MPIASLALIAIVALAPTLAVRAEVEIVVGPTAIPRGDATGATDITISNDLFAIAIAVETAPPWGVARGGILDIAPITDGKPGYDIASLADFMPNNWSSWPTSYQRVTIEKQTADEVIVRTVRDWGDVELNTSFRVADGDSSVHIVTSMTNKSKTAIEDLLSGYIVWPDGGALFGIPGMHGVNSGAEDDALADWSASYGESWVLGLHAPFAEYVDYGGRDRYLPHDLAPGETRSFEAWLQIGNDGTLAPLVQKQIDAGELPSGRVSGRITDKAGIPVPESAFVVTRQGKPYAWTLADNGEYEMNLPAGVYDIYATARSYARGEIESITVASGSDATADFDDVRPPGTVHIQVANKETSEALDARISIKDGYKPVISYFGKTTFFTQLQTVGATTEKLPPGNYVLVVSAGGGFTSTKESMDLVVVSASSVDLQVDIGVTATPHQRSWYSADLHHHSDVLDGFTEAEFVLRSELAAGVDIAFLSDHDSVINNQAMRVLSETRDMHFIPGAELSPSWAHFNAFPLDADKTVDIDTGQATVQQIFAAARRMGADVIEANHPHSGYGYFTSLDAGSVPGGYDDAFDLVEIVPENNAANEKTLARVWQMWNDGHRAYLAGGSDAHDVWLQESGSARTYVHVDGDLTIEKFVAGLKAGNSFASQGPLVYPEKVFGSEVQHDAGDTLALKHVVQAVSGLRSVQLIERGEEIEELTFDGADIPVALEFSVNPGADTWYSLVIEDMQGKFAYTNPVWVLVQ